MIFKRAIDDYLTLPRRDLGEVKRWSDGELSRRLSRLKPAPAFYTEPMRHQKVAFYLMAKLPCLMGILGLGLGKTKLTLDVIRWRKSAGLLSKVLILVPNAVNLEGWRLEIAKHAPDLTASYILGLPSERAFAFSANTDLCLSTYSGLFHLLCTRRAVKKKGKMLIDPKKLSLAQKRFDGIVWDEVQNLKNHLSLGYRIARALSARFKFRVGLTGTPMGRDPMDLWSQYSVVDRGESLGETISIFRQAFFTATPGYWGGMEYSFKKRSTNTLRRLMAHSALRYKTEECVDLPEEVPVERPFVMTDEQWSYYHAVLNKAQEKVGSALDLEGTFIRLRQIASGFVSIGGNPSSLTANPKLESLMELIGELPVGEKIVVFNEFIYSGDRIEAALKDLGINAARMYSGTRDKRAELRRFMDDPSCTAFIVNSQSGAAGLNLQVAPYVAFYETPVSPIVRQQAVGRCRRIGQSKTVFVFDLFAKNSVEKKILRFLAEGRDLREELIDGGLDLLRSRIKL
jgi:SNF2 family DNA or RNA helicase